MAKRATKTMAGKRKSAKRAVKKTTPKKRTAARKKLARGSAARAGGAGKSAAPKLSKRTPKKTAGPKLAKKATRAAKKPTPGTPAGVDDPIQFPEERPPTRKTHLTDDALQEFLHLLLAKRAELLGDVVRLTDQALSKNGAGQGESSSMPIHMADLGSDNWEQEFTLGLLANERALVGEIDDALRRIEARTYGICLVTHKRITKARLRAKPWAKYCIEYARAREEGRAV